ATVRGVRRLPLLVNAARNESLLRGNPEARPAAYELRPFRLDDAESATRAALRHSGCAWRRVAEGETPTGQSSRGRADAIRNSERNGRRHTNLSSTWREVGA